MSGELSGGSGDEGCDDVGGMAVEGDASAVVAHGGSRVGVACRFLDVTKGDARVEDGGDERVRKVCGPTFLVIPAWRAIRRTTRLAA